MQLEKVELMITKLVSTTETAPLELRLERRVKEEEEILKLLFSTYTPLPHDSNPPTVRLYSTQSIIVIGTPTELSAPFSTKKKS